MGSCWSSSRPPQLGKFLFKWSSFPSSLLKVGIMSHIHSDFQGDLKRLTAYTLTMKTRICEVRKGETFYDDLPKWASGSSTLHNLPKSSHKIWMKRYLGNKKSDLQQVNLPFLSAVTKLTKSREGRSTCHTVAVPLHRSTISRPKIIQIFSKTSRSKVCSIDISSPFFVFAIFLNSGLYIITVKPH